ncbi:YidC/Oxa1 family membrane protein insertase [Candidatus Microgenomates bacterium]|nr:YidC/Oxa1 family membrane protein insertase [Candidatus Microgenomates bacterium]
MFDIINFILINIVYQPFFNLLVVIYYLLQRINSAADMGMAVILFTIVFRIIILPLSLSSSETEKEREEMSKKLDEVAHLYKGNPVLLKAEKRKVFHSNKRVLFAEILDVGIQVLIAIMLYRIFSTGLEGADFHLLYPQVPPPSEPFNLVFLGKYDLSHPNLFLNIINSLVIFLAEALNIAKSGRPANREDKMALFVFPTVAFIFFAYMPAGKKLFVITTICFSIGIMVVQLGLFWYHKLKDKMNAAFYSRVKQ